MQRIVLRHLSGSKANQVEEFPLNHFNELVLGRDPSASVKYDPDRDDLVSSLHAKITPDSGDSNQFNLTDLNSRNGTFVNKQRIVGTSKLTPGDLVQLGPGGPEFKFDLEPRPMSTVKGTRSAEVGSLGATVPSTRQVDLGTPATRSVSISTPASSTPSTGTVGKATVERMISQNIAITKRTEGRRYMMMGGTALAIVVVLFVVIAGYLYYRGSASESQIGKVMASAPMTAAAIAKASSPAVVKIEVSWRLVSPTGAQVYHQYLSNVKEEKKGNKELYVTGAKSVACYLQLRDGTIEPCLVYTNDQYSLAISENFTATGFVVSPDGYILTNRHVAAAWQDPYNFKEGADTGVLFQENKDGSRGPFLRQIEEDEIPRTWIPALTKQRIDVKAGEFRGVNDRLDVVFPGTDVRTAAQLVQTSYDYDVAEVKVNAPNALPKVEPNDNYESIRSGDTVVVLGYPESALRVIGNNSQERRVQKEIPDPTVSSGNIGRLLRGREATGDKCFYSAIRDSYQLTVNSTDAGNSGGPVFDDRGRVIGIFYASRRSTDCSIALALPIRYGLQLMSAGSQPKR
jgi:serine protease Do